MTSLELVKLLGEPTEKGTYNFYGAVPIPEPRDPAYWDYEELTNAEGDYLRVSVYDGVVSHWHWNHTGPYQADTESDGGGMIIDHNWPDWIPNEARQSEETEARQGEAPKP